MWEEQLEFAKSIARKAGDKIMEYFRSSFDVIIKSDDSPVTSADYASNKLIIDAIKEKYPDNAILSEENDDDFSRLDKEFIWIIDPLDGTMDFVERGNGFAVNIALCHHHELIVGVVYVPVTEELFYASKGNGSYLLKGGINTKIHVNDKTNNLTCLTSIHYFNDKERDAINRHSDRISKSIPAGASRKACLIAKGDAEISYRYSASTKEWDTASPQIILEEAGGLILKPDGTPITYNRKDVYNREGFIMMNRKENFLL